MSACASRSPAPLRSARRRRSAAAAAVPAPSGSRSPAPWSAHTRRRTVATSSSSSPSNDPASYEYRPSADLLPPDFETVYRGHQGYLAFWRRWLDAFEDIRWDPEEILDFGDKALVTTQQSGHGSGSGVAVSIPVYQLFTFQRGLVIRQEDFLDRAEALEAAGRSE